MANVKSIITNSQGNVLISTETDTGHTLSVNGTGLFTDKVSLIRSGSNDQLLIKTNANNGSRIGHDSLGLYFSNDDASLDVLRIYGGASGAIRFSIDSSGGLFSNSGYLAYGDGTFTSLYAPDANGGITMGDATGPVNVYYNDTHVFQSAGQTSDYMRITSAGNVGIGTTAPGSRLEIAGTTGSYNSGIGFVPSGTGARNYRTYIATDGSFNFDDATAGATRINISANGNVGIGTTSPTSYMSGTYGLSVYKNDYPGIGWANSSSYWLWYMTGSTLRMWNSSAGDILTAHTTGNVLIGTAADAGYKLDVNGTGRFSNSLLVTTSSAGSLTAKIRNTVTAASGSTGYGLAIESEASAATSYALTVRNLAESTTYFHISTATGAIGNVGIGTTSPTVKLHVADSDGGRLILQGVGGSGINWQFNSYTDGKLYIGNYGVADYVTLTSTGNVGIGTTAPGVKLDIDGGFGGASVRVKGDQPAGAYYYGYMYDGTNLKGTTQTNIFYSGSTIAANTTIAEYAGLRIDAPIVSATGAVVTNNYGIYQSGSVQKNYFAGNVGIGTTSPSYKLDVAGSFNAVTSGVYLTYDNGILYHANYYQFGSGNNYLLYARASGDLILGSNDTERLRITSAGDVGIGTTSPSGKLSVDGGSFRFNWANPAAANYVWINRASGQDGGILLTKDQTLDWQIVNSGGGSDLHFYAYGASSTAMSLTRATANVLIGTTTDNGNKLRVNGTIYSDSTITAAQSTAETAAIIATSGWSGTANNPIITFGRTALAVAGALGYDDPNTGLYAGTTTNHRFAIRTNNSDKIVINAGGSLKFNSYGSGTVTGTPAYNLGVDASGNVIELPGGVVDGSGTANYVTKWQDANTVTDSQVFDNGTNVGINNATPKTKLDINGAIGFGSKTMSMTDTFAAALTLNMNDHNGCYVKLTAFGDWGNHSTIAYLGEFFIQASAGSYNEPGIIIRQVDNTGGGDDIQAQILDPAGAGTRDFIIELKATSSSNTPFTAYIQYEVRGMYNSVS